MKKYSTESSVTDISGTKEENRTPQPAPSPRGVNLLWTNHTHTHTTSLLSTPSLIKTPAHTSRRWTTEQEKKIIWEHKTGTKPTQTQRVAEMWGSKLMQCNTQRKKQKGKLVCTYLIVTKNKQWLVLCYLLSELVLHCVFGRCAGVIWGLREGRSEGSGIVLQRWTGGSWMGPVWNGACQGGPDSPMETWEKDKLAR